MRREPLITQYCKICLLPHDEEMHAATLAVRKWHRWQVIRGFEDEQEQQQTFVTEAIAEPRVA